MSETEMNQVCPLCGEEITKRQGVVNVSHEGREVPAHRNHFDTNDSPEAHGTIAEVAEVDRVPAPQDSAPLVEDNRDVAPAAPVVVDSDNQ
jgi:hypothetical protein